ncbi:class I SAM-dependent methyltransferase [Solidesulfovibrio carbinolicus]|uniref:Methyltransferase domain-containing protein n=1 Tax=Solidesulfovibrio carbinolicus TaxID=296842 RepID=A0A4P6I0F3_9BACT|nr:methyltransferase domain-containing protein [Solidesulfovibrio carbinolicus]QAZ67189.1 hypothetical protein C3Y92_08080 [Solidesulfovibrio carbinolicus]
MTSWINKSGRPLSSSEWLQIHHNAKINERMHFAKKILQSSPACIVDLGCGTGLWLNILDKIASANCHFIGIDGDTAAISKAKEISQNWKRSHEFIQSDIESSSNIPCADMFLVFNMFSYVNDSLNFLNSLHKKLNKNGCVVIRQYDEGTMRFGPMDNKERFEIEMSLFTALSDSNMFRHYDIDRTIQAISASDFTQKDIEFDVFEKRSPYTNSFKHYLDETINWNAQFLSETARNLLIKWQEKYVATPNPEQSYFVEVDLVATLS